jgi:LAO/AO transport system kinase
MLLCEASGYEVILVETVGVGQSEVAVRNMTDFFLLLMLAGAGDELQGIKKGIMEIADAVVVTKADGDNIKQATEAQAEYQHAMHLLPSKRSGWTPPVMVSSALARTGIAEVWKTILRYQSKTSESGYFEENRHQQNITWFHDYFQQLLKTDFQKFESLNKTMNDLSKHVGQEKISPYQGARQFLEAYHRAIRESRS